MPVTGLGAAGVHLHDEYTTRAAPVAVVNFSHFEEVLWPRWIARFKSGAGVGEYSYSPGKPTSVYGSSDMLMSMYVLKRLGHLADKDKDAWAKTINAFQVRAYYM